MGCANPREGKSSLREQVIRPTDWRWGTVIRNTIPEELERIELLEFPAPGRTFQLRIYTRAYFQELVTRNQPLQKAVLVRGVCR